MPGITGGTAYGYWDSIIEFLLWMLGSEDAIVLAHQQLMSYTEESPAMLQQVDNEQFARLNAKYHHYLMQFEKDEQTLKRKMDMFARLDSIVLKR